ncbi:trans-aconitate 2-methyltransferase [Phaeovulum sp.]|uniref:class I SAM-dependent methyltransferase n=1 Tax=Phaeovulum sp. TaxID=2934796 RepID=UPI0035685323
MTTPAFFTLYSNLLREGPGLPADVHWAIGVAGTPADADICDAGCGSGADAETLAEALPLARIQAIDITPSLAGEAQARLARFGARATARVGDMLVPGGPFDLIWCAGAAYFPGLGVALDAWRKVLKPKGKVAVSEPVLLERPANPCARAFWQGEPVELSDPAGLAARFSAAGFRIMGQRLLVGDPWQVYYASLAARIALLRKGQPSAALAEVLDASEREIAAWRRCPESIAYALIVAEPK